MYMSKYIVKCPRCKQLLRQTQKVPIVLLILLLGAITFAEKGDDERWEKAEKKVKGNYFPEAFKDSLRTFYNVGANRGLKSLPDHTLPFTREKCVYNGGWGFVKAGWAIIEAEVKKDNGIYIARGKAVTNNFTSAFFKARDFVYTTVDLKGFYPYFFEQHIRENRYKTNTWVIYDHEKGKVFSNRKKKKRIEYDISPFTHNYMSLLYFLRTIDFAPGDTFSINCFVHGKDYPVFFKVLGKEKIKVDAGTFKCIKVQPRLVGEGRGFTKKDKMYLWFTDDEYRMMVKGKSKIALGWITAELIDYERE